ncbi:hypothetical protein N7532_007469 [Penicillium argentinense]|uniref:DNA double-strand break repair and VJ recombination XRCC4 n=1 Tax=Penicillium argentinense TaxID=1131581 RepID=A0A9W9F7R8_9EURO|nr:uncharacterized protein N7532_007469 [Penicillium argentinense]KAJ5095178.1 hypothetical protein N7532_007469 [Penicillium argentinense]
MSSARILRFDRSDQHDSFVLLRVTHRGPDVLDLSLTATEGEGAYTASIQQSHLQDLKAKGYQGSDDEWTQTLSFVLGQSPIVDEPAGSLGVEATAMIRGASEESDEIVITIRKKVQDISQRLGAIVLREDDQVIELFEWTGASTVRSKTLEQQVTSLANRYRTAENTVQKLNEQLEDLMRAKSQHETQLMANFSQLLNEKKLKIRNQQRLLASATADPIRVSEIQATTAHPHVIDNVSRSSKRGHDPSDTDEDSDMGFEPMDVDGGKTVGTSLGDQETDEGGQSTPQPVEDRAGTTTDDDSEPEPEPHSKAVKYTPPSRDTPPPRRELPFTRRGPPARTQQKTVPGPAGDETAGETDDDEL